MRLNLVSISSRSRLDLVSISSRQFGWSKSEGAHGASGGAEARADEEERGGVGGGVAMSSPRESPTPLHYVLVDLQGTKSTTLILQGLQDGFPNPSTDVHRGVHELLGPINKDICDRACKALAVGDVEMLGKLMYEAQAAFDRLAQPACPSQLTMPLLHKVMDHAPLKELVYGIKGVGSQGDGTGQLLCKSSEAQAEVQKILLEAFSMPSITLSITSGPEITTAVIPAAGVGQVSASESFLYCSTVAL